MPSKTTLTTLWSLPKLLTNRFWNLIFQNAFLVDVKLDVLVQEIEDIPEAISLDTKREKPWGTAHAVWTARNVIKGSFVIINADDYYGQNAFDGAAKFIKNNDTPDKFALVAYNLKNTLSKFGSVSRGVCEVNNHQLTSIIERTKISEKDTQIIDEDSGVVLGSGHSRFYEFLDL